jgi:hypothetical protein
MKNSYSLAICQKLQTNFKKLKIIEKENKKKINKERNALFKKNEDRKNKNRKN